MSKVPEGVVIHRDVTGGGVYRVFWDPNDTGGLWLGDVEKGGSNFWSYRAWFIHGVPTPLIHGGVGSRQQKHYGYKTQAEAVTYLAQMKSSDILKYGLK